MFRAPAVTTRTGRYVWRMLLALLTLLALGGLVLLALSSGPADAAANFTVNKTGDGKDRKINGVCDASRKRGIQCTLRAAIQEANDLTVNPGPDTINFNIGGTSLVKTISPASPLPGITDPVTINGYTQPGTSPNTITDLAQGTNAVLKVQLNGTNAGTEAEPNPNGLVIFTSNSTIKGLVINRFKGSGIEILGDGSTDNKVEGNFLGTTASGTGALGNGGFGGVLIRLNASGNTIGGTSPDQRNLLSGNDVSGVAIFGSTNNKVEGNLIGTQKDGLTPLGNKVEGVNIAAASGNTIGGTASGEPNRIAHNGDDGIRVSFNGTGNRILSNEIYQNGIGHEALGIDLQGTNNVTENDTDDTDTGPNNLQNFPVITSATRSASTGITTITGTLNSNPSQTYTIQCFKADADSTDHGEGQTFIGDATTTTDTGGDSSTPFTCTSAPNALEVGDEVTMTATNTTTGDTSEFSLNAQVTST